ncbi:fructosamine kinase family protein [Ruegeria atlantica]|uniref:fructosamine kinase family protein n=1 Tax=Ruegeria atlantica TaxID=81569 RepID=UPI00147E6AF3|nr:fructosamine kinase family protein [Ruegeria atlantica]
MNNQRSDGIENLLVKHISRLLDDSVLSCHRLHGGGLSEVVRLLLGSGKNIVAKSGPYPEREGQMLRVLAEAGANVPRPIASNSDVLVLEDLGPEVPSSDGMWQDLGAQLRVLHAETGDLYGWESDYAFGNMRIDNGWKNRWSEFWFEQRLAADIHVLPPDIARRLEKLQRRITALLPDRPRPSLLHGDLWSGNVYFAADGKAYLIDPASYYGHAEVDLAMLTLFGAPPGAFWDVYGHLGEGWQHRRHAYQLWPALVHFRLFGEGYRAMVETLLAALDE